jgi:hypothetical protein
VLRQCQVLRTILPNGGIGGEEAVGARFGCGNRGIALHGHTHVRRSNGVDGPNTYGTHDWILDHALDGLGDRADWVCRRAALRATDDPDTVDGIDHASGTWWHVWNEWGDTWGGAPEAVRVWFDRAQRRLEAGRECSASRALGIPRPAATTRSWITDMEAFHSVRVERRPGGDRVGKRAARSPPRVWGLSAAAPPGGDRRRRRASDAGLASRRRCRLEKRPRSRS